MDKVLKGIRVKCGMVKGREKGSGKEKVVEGGNKEERDGKGKEE